MLDNATTIRIDGQCYELLDCKLVRAQAYTMLLAKLFAAHHTGASQEAMPVKEVHCVIFLECVTVSLPKALNPLINRQLFQLLCGGIGMSLMQRLTMSKTIAHPSNVAGCQSQIRVEDETLCISLMHAVYNSLDIINIIDFLSIIDFNARARAIARTQESLYFYIQLSIP